MIFFIGTHGSFRAYCRDHGISPLDTRVIRCVREPRQLRGVVIREGDEIVWGDNSARTHEWHEEIRKEIHMARLVGKMSS